MAASLPGAIAVIGHSAVAAQHQQFISGQTSTEQNEEMEMMEIQDAEEENEESIPDEDSTEPALTYH